MTRHKHPPCPTCLAVGTTTYGHIVCSDGPPPEHGMACDCPGCDGERVDAIVKAAREVLLKSSIYALDHLQDAFSYQDAAASANMLYWARHKAMIAEARTLRAVA